MGLTRGYNAGCIGKIQGIGKPHGGKNGEEPKWKCTEETQSYGPRPEPECNKCTRTGTSMFDYRREDKSTDRVQAPVTLDDPLGTSTQVAVYDVFNQFDVNYTKGFTPNQVIDLHKTHIRPART